MDCGSPLLLLTCALLMTSSHSEGRGGEVKDVTYRNINMLEIDGKSAHYIQ